jgi:hypothetical protein
MANKASFTPEEWTKVLESVAVTGMAVTAAEPSGLWGMLKEALAGGAAPEGRDAVQEALKQRFEGAKAIDVVPRALETLRQASAILDAKAPADAPGFKAWLNSIAAKVAEAS